MFNKTKISNLSDRLNITLNLTDSLNINLINETNFNKNISNKIEKANKTIE